MRHQQRNHFLLFRQVVPNPFWLAEHQLKSTDEKIKGYFEHSPPVVIKTV